MLWSAIRNEEIEKLRELSDEETQAVVGRQMKQLADALKDFETGGRADLVAQTKQELQTLATYLPAQLPEDELRRIVEASIREVGATSAADVGKVMGAVMKAAKGKADGNRVRSLVSELLGKT